MSRKNRSSDFIALALPFGMMAGTIIGMIAGFLINAEIMIYTLAAGTTAGYLIGLMVYLILHHQLNSRDQSDL